jgi:hypothetical protein
VAIESLLTFQSPTYQITQLPIYKTDRDEGGTPSCKPIVTRSKGEAWQDTKVQSAAFAVAKA